MPESHTYDRLAGRIITLLRLAAQVHVVSTSLKVALLVGITLNAINNGGRLLNGETISWLQFGLNFVVPYCVSSYGAARNELRRVKGE